MKAKAPQPALVGDVALAALALQPESSGPSAFVDGPSSNGTSGSATLSDVPEDASVHPGIGSWVQPVVGAHVSVVQGSPSSQLSQRVHEVAPGLDAYAPGGHGVQTVSASGAHAEDAYVPGGQTLHGRHEPPSR